MLKRVFTPDTAPRATLWYLVLAVVMTWPVARHLATAIPDNLGDPLLNAWILGWDASRLLRLLHGDVAALAGFWNANIFYPEPLTLAYSEHLFAQAVQILPVYALTGNLILCYNLLFLSTFVLSALGMFLLTRELTGNGRAAFVAGLLFGFALFRAQHLGHLQILSSQWMPFALFGLRRYFITRRWPALAGAMAALVAQNLSCGYYLVFFAPFVAGYVLYEMVSRHLLRDRRAWLSLLVAGAVVVGLTAPFLAPYAALRASGPAWRSVEEVDSFSADLASYVTAFPRLRFWGPRLQAAPSDEASLFPGLVPLALALAGIGWTAWRRWKRAPAGGQTGVSPGPLAGFSLVAMAVALWLSFGRSIRLLGRPVTGLTIYDWLYRYVPGFDGLRVSARFGMIAMLFAAILAGIALEAIARRGRFGRGLVLALGVVFLAEAAFAPVDVRAVWPGADATLPGALGPGAPRMYAFVRTLPPNAVLAEFPFGQPGMETLFIYASTLHWRALVNGYSGRFPDSYRRTYRSLGRPLDDRARACRTLQSSGATHAIIHGSLFRDDAGQAFSAWLRGCGAQEIVHWDTERIFAIPTKGVGSN